MSDAPRTFLVEVIHTKTYRVIVGGPNGSVRIEEDESDEDAVEALVNDHVHLPEFMLPLGMAIEAADTEIESIKEIVNA